MAIDIGAGAADYNSTLDVGNGWFQSKRDKTNPANADGTLDTLEIWMNQSATGIVIFTVAPAGTTARDSESIGSVTSGAKRTYTGKNLDVVTGDYIGVYNDASKNIEMNSSAGSGTQGFIVDGFYDIDTDAKLALYGTGSEPIGLPIFMHYYQNIMR